MKPWLLLVVLATCLEGCGGSADDVAVDQAPRGSPAIAEPTPPSAADSALAQALRGHHWRLQRAVDNHGGPIRRLFVSTTPSLQLDFGDDGRVALSHACNPMGGAYSLEHNHLDIGRMASTRMACDDVGRTGQERAAGSLLSGNFRLLLSGESQALRLTLLRSDGTRLEFLGNENVPVIEDAPGEPVLFEIASHGHPCEHRQTSGQRCLRVREVRFGSDGMERVGDGRWQRLEAPIGGYDHIEGMHDIIRVRRYRHPGSDDVYVLEGVLETRLSTR